MTVVFTLQIFFLVNEGQTREIERRLFPLDSFTQNREGHGSSPLTRGPKSSAEVTGV